MATSGSSGIEVPKPKFSVYTLMLILAVLAIAVGVGLLWMVLGRYDFEYTGPVSLLFSLPASMADAGAGSVIAGV